MATAFSTSEKAVNAKRERFSRVPIKPIKETAAPAPSACKPKRPTGRPGVKTPEVCRQILEVLRSGLPLKFAAASVGVSDEALRVWRAKDQKFSKEVELVRMASVKERWELIQKAARGNGDTPGDWKAAAWSIERTWPQEFGRPEVQLNHIHQTAITTHNSLVISAVVARDLESRSAPVRRKIEQLFSSHVGGREASVRALEAPMNGDLPLEPVKSVEPVKPRELVEPVIEMKLPPLEMPPTPPTRWWSQLTRGDNTREVSLEAAVQICRTILEDVMGKQRAQSIEVKFDEGPVLVRDLHQMIESTCGSRGWTALTKRGKSRQ